MQGHARTSGMSFQTITVGGKLYKLRPFRMSAYAEIEAYILSLREDPITLAAQAAAQAPESQHAVIWETAFKLASKSRTVSREELAQFDNTLMGLACRVWICLKEDHADEFPRPEDVLPWMERIAREKGEDATKAELQAKVSVASQQADLGNSSGPTPGAERATTAV